MRGGALFGAPAIGDVANEGAEKPVVPDLELRKRSLGGENRTIPASKIQLEALVQRRIFRAAQETGQAALMQLAALAREDEVDERAANRLFAGPPE